MILFYRKGLFIEIPIPILFPVLLYITSFMRRQLPVPLTSHNRRDYALGVFEAQTKGMTASMSSDNYNFPLTTIISSRKNIIKITT